MHTGSCAARLHLWDLRFHRRVRVPLGSVVHAGVKGFSPSDSESVRGNISSSSLSVWRSLYLFDTSVTVHRVMHPARF